MQKPFQYIRRLGCCPHCFFLSSTTDYQRITACRLIKDNFNCLSITLPISLSLKNKWNTFLLSQNVTYSLQSHCLCDSVCNSVTKTTLLKHHVVKNFARPFASVWRKYHSVCVEQTFNSSVARQCGVDLQRSYRHSYTGKSACQRLNVSWFRLKEILQIVTDWWTRTILA